MLWLDQALLGLFRNLVGWWRLLDGLIVFFAEYFGYFLVAFLVLQFLLAGEWRRRWFFFAESALAVLVSRGVVTELIRFFYSRPRPFAALSFQPLFQEASGSFPSGHLAFFAALGTILLFYHRRFGWIFLGLTLLIGLARIAAGVHWPSDIVGGALIGAAVALGVRKLLEPYRGGRGGI